MRYWLYKNNYDGGPAGYYGDWLNDVFSSQAVSEWGGHYATTSAEVAGVLNHEVAAGDVVVAYQTNMTAVVGFLTIDKITGPLDGKKLYLQPIHRLPVPFLIHRHKRGTPLENSPAVKGPVMLRELQADEMTSLVALSGAPQRVLRGGPPRSGYKP